MEHSTGDPGVDRDSAEDAALPSRRALLSAAVGGSVAMIAAAPAGASPPAREPLIEKWLRTKKVRVGAQLSQRPTGFIDDATGLPSGFEPALFTKMIRALSPDIEIEWIDLPVSELILAWLSGKFDMLGQSLAGTPARALLGWFTAIPTAYESGVAIVRKDSSIASLADLRSPGVRIAVIQGGVESTATHELFPKARITEFQSAINAGTEVAVGRADASILGAHNVAIILNRYANLTIVPGKPLFLDASGWMLPLGDLRTLEWVNNYLRFASVSGAIAAEWKKWYVPVLKPFRVVAVTVGPMGAPLYVDTAAA